MAMYSSPIKYSPFQKSRRFKAGPLRDIDELAAIFDLKDELGTCPFPEIQKEALFSSGSKRVDIFLDMYGFKDTAVKCPKKRNTDISVDDFMRKTELKLVKRKEKENAVKRQKS